MVYVLLTYSIEKNLGRNLSLEPYEEQTVCLQKSYDQKKREIFAEWYFKTQNLTDNRIICTDGAYFKPTFFLNTLTIGIFITYLIIT